LRDDNAVPCNDRRVVLAPFAGVAVNKEKNAALAVIMGWLVIKGDTISPVLVVKAIFFFNFREPLKTRLKIFHFPLIFSIIKL